MCLGRPRGQHLGWAPLCHWPHMGRVREGTSRLEKLIHRWNVTLCGRSKEARAREGTREGGVVGNPEDRVRVSVTAVRR